MINLGRARRIYGRFLSDHQRDTDLSKSLYNSTESKSNTTSSLPQRNSTKSLSLASHKKVEIDSN
ncbi:hypothetical protein YC2023_069164 [Brassica napus]